MSEVPMVDLSTFTYEQMLGQVGSRFRIDFNNAPTVTLELVRVDRLMDKHTHPRLVRDTFALVFLGPVEPLLAQQMYYMQHEVLGAPLPIFIVPISKDAEGVRYEAVFG
ncbi:MAG TPA: hypothetical protein VF698_05575 [Thermoanaerobaculia bacterium]|jgi:hypothetical protein